MSQHRSRRPLARARSKLRTGPDLVCRDHFVRPIDQHLHALCLPDLLFLGVRLSNSPVPACQTAKDTRSRIPAVYAPLIFPCPRYYRIRTDIIRPCNSRAMPLSPFYFLSLFPTLVNSVPLTLDPFALCLALACPALFFPLGLFTVRVTAILTSSCVYTSAITVASSRRFPCIPMHSEPSSLRCATELP